jgi:murein hydrolase activator
MAAPLVALALCSLAEPSLLGELDRVDKELAAAESRIESIEAEGRLLSQRLATIDVERAAAELRAAEVFAQYRTRLRALARMPAGARLLFLGEVRSLSEYLQDKRLLRFVASHDRKLHDSYLAENARLASLAAQVSTQREQLEGLLLDTRAERDATAERRRERVDLLRRVTAKPELLRREQGEARRQLSSMFGKLAPAGRQNESFAKNRGRLPWPAAGTAGAAFGQQRDLASGTTTTHSGLDILAKPGSLVQAVATGQVVFAGWLTGFGQVVILDHGDDYHSVSAHLESISVAVGDTVAGGAPLGTVGDTGSVSGTLLYFEIRHAGLPEDPRPWLRK